MYVELIDSDQRVLTRSHWEGAMPAIVLAAGQKR
jgi:hypothetical protein